MTAIDRIKPFAEGKDDVHVVIDTPRGSRNKLKWDRKLEVLKLSHVLTAGAVFPFDFGFVPGTHGADGDALDVLVLSDEPLFPLCLVQARLIGLIEAEQTQDGKTIRNDRMVAVAVGSRLYAKVSGLDDLPPTLMDEIEQFFINYNKNARPCVQADREGRRGRGNEVGEAQHCKSRKETTLEVPAGNENVSGPRNPCRRRCRGHANNCSI